MKKRKNRLRKIARYTSLAIAILIFLFALVSGSEDYGGGFRGIIQNSPNALPWAIFLILTGIAWRWELIGGILITIFGFSAMYFFNFSGSNFFWFTFIFTLIITILGLFFIISWYMESKD